MKMHHNLFPTTGLCKFMPLKLNFCNYTFCISTFYIFHMIREIHDLFPELNIYILISSLLPVAKCEILADFTHNFYN